jgi:hypothetical protein
VAIVGSVAVLVLLAALAGGASPIASATCG